MSEKKSREHVFVTFRELLKELVDMDEEKHANVMMKLRLYRNESIIAVLEDGPNPAEIEQIKKAIASDRAWFKK